MPLHLSKLIQLLKHINYWNPAQQVSAQKVSGHKVSKNDNMGQKASSQKVSTQKVSSHKVSEIDTWPKKFPPKIFLIHIFRTIQTVPRPSRKNRPKTVALNKRSLYGNPLKRFTDFIMHLYLDMFPLFKNRPCLDLHARPDPKQ